jgi:hypothetical protein
MRLRIASVDSNLGTPRWLAEPDISAARESIRGARVADAGSVQGVVPVAAWCCAAQVGKAWHSAVQLVRGGLTNSEQRWDPSGQRAEGDRRLQLALATALETPQTGGRRATPCDSCGSCGLSTGGGEG